jgi:SAM-dependent methyltransferase
VNKAESWTEDLYAMDKLAKAGWKFYADGTILCDHWDMTNLIPARLPFGSRPLVKQQLNGKKRVVDLGCGEFPYEPKEDEVVITVDARDEVKPDYRADLRRLPFGSGEFDVVTSNHTLEHFNRGEVDAVLDEWIRVMKPDGEFRVRVPNLIWAADQIMNGVVNHDVLNVLYGEQSYDLNFHRVGFTPAVLTALLEARGLEVIEMATEGYNIEIIARRAMKITMSATKAVNGKRRNKGVSAITPTKVKRAKK